MKRSKTCYCVVCHSPTKKSHPVDGTEYCRRCRPYWSWLRAVRSFLWDATEIDYSLEEVDALWHGLCHTLYEEGHRPSVSARVLLAT